MNANCKRTKNWKVLLRKAKSYKNRYHCHKIVPNSAWKWPVESVSCHRINYRPKTIGDDSCTIVRLSSDAIVRCDYPPNPNDNRWQDGHHKRRLKVFLPSLDSVISCLHSACSSSTLYVSIAVSSARASNGRCWFKVQLRHERNVKGKRYIDLYSAPSWEAHLWSAQVWIVFTLQTHHTCLYLVSVYQRAPPLTSNSSHLIAAYYSFIDPKRMKGWVGLV